LSASLTEEKVQGWIEPWHDPHLDREYGLPSYDIAIRALENGFEANISVVDWRIKIGFDPDYISTACQKLSFPTVEGDRVGANTAALLYLHEVAHWRCCPFDADGHGRILQGLTEGLGLELGKSASAETIHRLCNIFADVIVNVSRVTEDPNSQVRRMYEQAWMDISRFLCQDKLDRVPPLGKVFISIQYRLMNGKDVGMGAVVEEMEKEHGVKKAVEDLIPVFRSDTKGRLVLSNRSKWQEQARKFAEIVKAFLPPPENKQDGQEAQDSGNKKDKAKEGGEEGETKPLEIPSCTDNAFSKRFKEDAEYREQVIRSMLQRDAKPDSISIAPRSVVLSSYYSERARQIVLKAKDTGDSPRLPIAHTGVRRIESGELISPGQIRWSATRLYPGTDLQLFEKAHPLTIQRPAEQMPGRLPDLLFALDSSASMRWRFSPDPRSRPASDGTFDLGLLAFFGILHWLEATGSGPYLQYAAVNFSSLTISTDGWHSHFNSKPVWDVLSKYQSGSTKLDANCLRRLRDQHSCKSDASGAGCTDTFWMVLLTDGEIQNAREVADVLQEFMSEGHAITLIQLGGSTEFARTMRGKGADVHVIENEADLVGLVLERAQSVWSPRPTCY
jgi:hypothetical protein